MKILVANKYHFPKGGSERYYFNIMDILKKNGHAVIPFAVDFPGTTDTPYRKYFVSPPSKAGVQLHQFQLGPKEKIGAAVNAFYSKEAKANIRDAIRSEGIDLAYLLNFSNYLSPSIIDGCKKEGIPVVLRFSDYYLFCLNALFFRRDKFRCYDCVYGKYYKGVAHRCLNGSLGASVTRAASMYFHDILRIYKKADAVVTTNSYMSKLLIENGYPEKKTHLIFTPVDVSAFSPSYEHEDIILYFGRIIPEKGVDVLLKAFAGTKNKSVKLIIAGDDTTDEAGQCKKYCADNNLDNIQFIGKKNMDEIKVLLARSLFTVSPSLWPENSPNNISESFAAGKAILASRVPGVLHQVKDGETGYLYSPEDVDEMATKMDRMIENEQETIAMGRNAREFVEKEFSPQKHYKKLITVFNSLADNI